MKKIAFFTGALSTSIVMIGILFKYFHWPFANVLIAIGIVLFALFFVPTMTKYIYDRPSRDEL
ncbi:GldL-related protein [Mesonia mobilis]|uniref:Gliding motility protein GldL-like N-terminal domain-containing protein n=1 Tax=Mesonia mobilis TaxID=369791 RepID=A0ABQ3BZG8_9FLAO|nr:hypothetical protein [Mesonia mobilis]MBQ0737802.1 hypothetical protein [Aquimarina celericrescens]GGZ61922.1 hypothetical protein GCM10008088_24290 [Mesonia mobilis]